MNAIMMDRECTDRSAQHAEVELIICWGGGGGGGYKVNFLRCGSY